MTIQKDRPFELAQVRMRARELAPGTYAVMADDVEEVDHTATNAGSWSARAACWSSSR